MRYYAPRPILLEDGTITEWKLDRAFGNVTQPDPAFGYTMRTIPTGQETVTIVLEAGNLSRAKMQAWLPEQTALIGEL